MKKIFYGKYSIGEVLMAAYAVLFCHRFLVPFHKLLFHFALRGVGVYNSINFKVSGEHWFIHTYLPGLLKEIEKPIFFDVEANEGAFSVQLRKAFSDAEIIAVEPHPLTYGRVVGRLESLGGKVLNCALGNAESKLTLYDVADSSGTSHASLFSDVVKAAGKGVSSHEVRVRRLDDVAKECGAKRIDFLKVDTEGNEFPVFEGAGDLLEGGAIKVILFEFNEMNAVSGYFMRDFAKKLEGYTLYRLLPRGLLPLNDLPVFSELYAYQNIIAVWQGRPR